MINMFGKFGGEYINFKAVSEITLQQMNGDFKIQAFRLDGSFLASETYTEAEDAVRAYNNLWDWMMNAGIASTMR